MEAGRLTLNYTRNPAASDVTLTVQGADNLGGTWTDLARSINGAPTTARINGVGVTETGSGDTRTVKVSDRYPVSGGEHPPGASCGLVLTHPKAHRGRVARWTVQH